MQMAVEVVAFCRMSIMEITSCVLLLMVMGGHQTPGQVDADKGEKM